MKTVDTKHLETKSDAKRAAVAAAREEQREACARSARLVGRDDCVAVVRATPLTATPLADELERSWQETARMVERAEKAEAERDAVVMLLSAKLVWTVASELMAGNALRAAEAIVERLNATENERDDATIASKRWQASCAEALSERDALRAQVEAARAACASWGRANSAGPVTRAILAAMDGAKP